MSQGPHADCDSKKLNLPRVKRWKPFQLEVRNKFQPLQQEDNTTGIGTSTASGITRAGKVINANGVITTERTLTLADSLPVEPRTRDEKPEPELRLCSRTRRKPLRVAGHGTGEGSNDRKSTTRHDWNAPVTGMPPNVRPMSTINKTTTQICTSHKSPIARLSDLTGFGAGHRSSRVRERNDRAPEPHLRTGRLNILTPAKKSGFVAPTHETRDKWERVPRIIDSGASLTVYPPECSGMLCNH